MRIRLTVLLIGLYAIGLVGLAIVVVSRDAKITNDRIATELRAPILEANPKVHDVNGTIDASGLRTGAFTDVYPQLYAVVGPAPPAVPVTGDDPGTEPPFSIVARPARPRWPGADAVVTAAAHAAATRGGEVSYDVWTDQATVQLLAVPLEQAPARGALVTLIDPKPLRDDHRSLVLTVWAGVGVLIALGTAVTFLLAFRSRRRVLPVEHRE